MHRLIVIKGPGLGAIYPLVPPKVSLGRGTHNTFELPLIDISRQHAELWFEGAELRVRDLGSSNGTFLNDQRVSESLVQPGDRLRLGKIELRYEAPDASPDPDLARQNSDLVTQLAAAQQQISTLSDELTALRAKFHETSAPATAQIEALTSHCEQLIAQLDAHEQHKHLSATRLRSAEDQLAALRAQNLELSARCQKVEQQMFEAETRHHLELQQAQSAVLASRAAVAPSQQIAERVATLTAENETQAHQLAAANQRVQIAEASLARIKAAHAIEAEKLHSEIAQATDRIGGLQTELEQQRKLAVRSEELTSANHRLRGELAAAIRKSDESNQNLEVREVEFAQITAARAELEKQTASLSQRLRLAEGEFVTLRERTSTLSAKLQETEQQLDETKRQSQLRTDRLADELAAANQQLARAKTTGTDLAAHCAELTNANQQLRAELTASLKKYGETHQTLQVREAEFSRVDATRAEIEQQNSALTQRIRSAETDLTALRERAATLTTKLQTTEQQLDDVKRQRQVGTNRLADELAAANQRLTQAEVTETDLARARSELQAATQAAARATLEIATLTTSNHELLQEISALRLELDAATKKRSDLDLRLAEQIKELNRVQAKLKAAQQQSTTGLTEARRSNVDLSSQLEMERDARQRESDHRLKIAAELSDARSESIRLRAELSETKTQLQIADAASLRVAELTELTQRLEKDIATAREQLAGEAQARAILATETNRAQDELKRLQIELAAAAQRAADEAKAHRDSEIQLARARIELQRLDLERAAARTIAQSPAAAPAKPAAARASGIRPVERRYRSFC